MRNRMSFIFVLGLAVALSSFAQKPSSEAPKQQQSPPPRANGGRIPPPPPERKGSRAEPEVEKLPGGKLDKRPHVNNNHWYGHENPNDPRFRLARPFEHGHIQQVGPSYRYSVVRVNPQTRQIILVGGFIFEVAEWDWFLCSDWCWNCPDEFVVYLDPDHPGWYLIYDIQIGVYVHAIFFGVG